MDKETEKSTESSNRPDAASTKYPFTDDPFGAETIRARALMMVELGVSPHSSEIRALQVQYREAKMHELLSQMMSEIIARRR